MTLLSLFNSKTCNDTAPRGVTDMSKNKQECLYIAEDFIPFWHL